ncbi:unnamed protein product, partial [Brenthis ino]
MDPQELVPLEFGLPRPRPTRQFSQRASRSCNKGPIRLCRLLSLMIVLPCLFIFIPLHMRYRAFSGQMYPMGMTDMRLIDSKISPTWCQVGLYLVYLFTYPALFNPLRYKMFI